jgi:hypothetical protein
MAKRRDPGPIFREWDNIVFGHRESPVEKRWEMWLKLHAECFQDGRWVAAVRDADLITPSGQYLCIERGDFGGAVKLGLDLLGHPDFRCGDYTSIEETLKLIGFARLMLGRFDEACETFECILDKSAVPWSKSRPNYLSRHFVVGPICWVADFEPTKPIHPRVKDLLVRTVSQIPGRKRLSAQFALAETYSDLDGIREMV